MSRRRPFVRVLLVLAGSGMLASCSGDGQSLPQPAARPGEAQPGGRPAGDAGEAPAAPAPIAPAANAAEARLMQAQVMDFADDLSIRLAEATDVIEQRPQAPEARVVAHRLKYSVAQGATAIAAAANPQIALVDMMVMISLQRTLLEKNIMPVYFGPEAERLLGVFTDAERQIRQLAGQALTTEQLVEIDRLVARWLEENPDRKYAAYVRLSDFAAARQAAVQVREGRGPSNVLGFLFLDPLSGLDPTTREIEQARLFAERAFFYLQRMPVLISWQAELLYVDTMTEPEMRELVVSTQRLTASFERVTDEVAAMRAELPQLVAAERQAVLDRTESMLADERQAVLDRAEAVIAEQRREAIDQVFAGVRDERTALLDDLEQRQEELSIVARDLRDTLQAGTALSDSVRETTANISAFTAQMREGKPPDQPPGEPFDIRDYTEAVRETTAAAEELTRLADSLTGATDPEILEARLALIETRIAEAEGTANRLIDRMFLVGGLLIAGLVLGLIVVVVIAGLVRVRVARAASAAAARARA